MDSMQPNRPGAGAGPDGPDDDEGTGGPLFEGKTVLILISMIVGTILLGVLM